MNAAAAPWPDIAGRLIPGGHVLPVRVYFEDTDFSGVVYHANYLRFMERGRSDFIRLAGIGHAELDDGAHGERLAFVVRHIDVDFLKPARIDDLIEVETRVENIAGVRVVLRQRVVLAGVSLTEADVTIVLVNREGKVRRLPRAVRERLSTTSKS